MERYCIPGYERVCPGKNEEAKPLLENAFAHLQEGKLRSQVGIELTAVYEHPTTCPML